MTMKEFFKEIPVLKSDRLVITQLTQRDAEALQDIFCFFQCLFHLVYDEGRPLPRGIQRPPDVFPQDPQHGHDETGGQ